MQKGLAISRGKGYYIDNFHSRGFAPRENLKFKRVEIMNKSKFLKKSLAMLLALMLVVAMIPLSASAAQTDYINYLYVNGQNAAVDGDGYSVTVGTPKVSLNANLKENVKLYYLDGEGEEQAIPSTIINLALDGYTSTSDAVYEMTIIAKVQENPDVSDAVTEYTYPLTITVDESANSDDTALQGLAAGADTWTHMTDWSVDNETHNVTVNLKFGANHPTLRTAGGTLDDDDFEPVNSEAEVTVIDANTITVTAGTESRTEYKVTYVNEPAFESFEIPGQVGETEFTYGSGDYNRIDINVGYGYDYKNVIPTFELVEELADNDVVENGYADYVFTSGVTPIPWNSTDYDTRNPMSTITGDGWKYEFTVETAQDYNGSNDGYTNVFLYIHAVQKNPAGDLLTVKVEDSNGKASNTTEVTANTPTNSVMMPVDADLDANSTYSVVLTYSKGATVTVSSKNYNNKVVVDSSNPGDATTNDPLVYTTTVSGIQLNEGNSFSVTVKSQDGEVTNVYNINLDQETTAEAKLTSVTFKDKGDNNKLYKAEIDHAKKEVVLTVPYSWKNTSTLTDVVVYMEASTGATITHSKTTNPWKETFNGNDNDGTTALSALVGANGGNWFPYPGAANEANATSQVVVTNRPDNDNEVKNTYTIKIETETAKGGRTIKSLNFSDKEWEKDITADNTFAAELGTAVYDNKSTNGQKVNTIKVTVPYSWKGNTIRLYNLEMDDGAKLYNKDPNWEASNVKYGVDATGHLTYKIPVTAANFDVVKDGKIANADMANMIPVRVLSEANSVNFSETSSNDEPTTALNTENMYTEYLIYLERAKAESGCELLTMESVDENVTATLEGQTITVNVPATYDGTNKFKLKFTTSKLATVFQNYDQATDTFTDVLESNKTDFYIYKDANDVKMLAVNSKAITNDEGMGKIWVRAEDEVNAKAYDVKLVVNKVETGADVTALSVNGTAATIARDQINVRLPLGTKLYPVTLDIEASKMAAVYVSPTNVTDPASYDDTYLYDPEARYDVNRSVKITVVAEDGKTSKIYTLNAIVESSFKDVTTDKWYYDEVMTAANAGWINGDEPGYYNPEGTMTRGAFITIIARILGCDTEATVESLYPDCNETDWFNAAVTFCSNRGIIGGDNGFFKPNDPITREEMAKILCNALELDELETSADPFEDDAEIAQWAKGYVNAVQAEGIFEGADGYFNPRDNATRAEGAAVLVRAFA